MKKENNLSKSSEPNANGYNYVDLGLTSGTLWATMNVGATSETDYGQYFQWGDTTGYRDSESHNFNCSTYMYCDDSLSTFNKYNNKSDYGTVDNKTALDLEDDAAHAKWGGDWKMPTQEQLEELYSETNHEWITNYNDSGINGILFSSKKDSSKHIFIPASGYRSEKSVIYQGIRTYMWSSSLVQKFPHIAWGAIFHKGYVGMSGEIRICGRVVRPVL